MLYMNFIYLFCVNKLKQRFNAYAVRRVGARKNYHIFGFIPFCIMGYSSVARYDTEITKTLTSYIS